MNVIKTEVLNSVHFSWSIKLQKSRILIHLVTNLSIRENWGFFIRIEINDMANSWFSSLSKRKIKMTIKLVSNIDVISASVDELCSAISRYKYCSLVKKISWNYCELEFINDSFTRFLKLIDFFILLQMMTLRNERSKCQLNRWAILMWYLPVWMSCAQQLVSWNFHLLPVW